MGAFGRIDAVVLFVNDLARARAFYEDVIGLRLKSEDEGFAEFELDNTTIGLLDISTAKDLVTADAVSEADARIGAKFQIAAYVEDVIATHSELVGKGVMFIKAPTDQPWGQRTANFVDPDGNIWEISQWIADESNSSEAESHD